MLRKSRGRKLPRMLPFFPLRKLSPARRDLAETPQRPRMTQEHTEPTKAEHNRRWNHGEVLVGDQVGTDGPAHMCGDEKQSEGSYTRDQEQDAAHDLDRCDQKIFGTRESEETYLCDGERDVGEFADPAADKDKHRHIDQCITQSLADLARMRRRLP